MAMTILGHGKIVRLCSSTLRQHRYVNSFKKKSKHNIMRNKKTDKNLNYLAQEESADDLPWNKDPDDQLPYIDKIKKASKLLLGLIEDHRKSTTTLDEIRRETNESIRRSKAKNDRRLETEFTKIIDQIEELIKKQNTKKEIKSRLEEIGRQLTELMRREIHYY